MRLNITFPAAIACVCVAASAVSTSAQEKTGASVCLAIAPIVDDQTFLVAHVDLRELDAGGALDRLTEILKLPASDRAALSLSRAALVDTVSTLKKAGARELFVVSSITDLPGAPYVFAVPVDAKTEIAPIVARLGSPLLHGAQGAAHDRVGNLLLIGGSRAIERLKSIKPTARPELAAACDAVAGSTAQVLLVPPAEVRRIIEEMMPHLPLQLGGGASRILTQGALWGAIGFDVSPQKMAARAVVQSADPAAAVALNAELSKMLQAVGQTSEIERLVPKFAEFAQAIKPTVSGDRLTLELNEANGGLSALASLVAPPVEAARAAASRFRSTNNLKQIMLAMHNYASANKTFPARASYSAEGKPLLSWRVHLLPYLEGREGDALYKQFKLDEPWDSEHNRKLIDRMPDVLRSPLSAASAGRTTYVVPVLEGGIFGGREPLEFKQITDGLSNTIAIVEADDDHAVVWTKPDDIEIDLGDPARGLRRATIGGFLAGMADGSVRFLAADLGADVLKPAFTASGKEPVRLP